MPHQYFYLVSRYLKQFTLIGYSRVRLLQIKHLLRGNLFVLHVYIGKRLHNNCIISNNIRSTLSTSNRMCRICGCDSFGIPMLKDFLKNRDTNVDLKHSFIRIFIFFK